MNNLSKIIAGRSCIRQDEGKNIIKTTGQAAAHRLSSFIRSSASIKSCFPGCSIMSFASTLASTVSRWFSVNFISKGNPPSLTDCSKKALMAELSVCPKDPYIASACALSSLSIRMLYVVVAILHHHVYILHYITLHYNTYYRNINLPHLLQTLSNRETCYNTASGCPCLDVRATPFVFVKTACQLLTAVFVHTETLTPCCGHGLDHQRRQARQRSDKPHHLDNQVHGQLTSFPQGRRCQHTGLIPLTTPNYITKSNICSLFAHIDSDRKAA